MADKMATARNIGVELTKALGLFGKDVQSIDIRVRAGEPVSVMVRFAPTYEQFGACIEVLKHYHLQDQDPSKCQGHQWFEGFCTHCGDPAPKQHPAASSLLLDIPAFLRKGND